MTDENARTQAREHAKKIFESSKEELKKDARNYKELGELFDGLEGSIRGSDNRMLGPRNDIEYQKMKKTLTN